MKYVKISGTYGVALTRRSFSMTSVDDKPKEHWLLNSGTSLPRLRTQGEVTSC